jgi:hypothetical protein
MRKWGALAIGGVLLISLATPVNAAAPKAGATCTKKNATATSAGKLYTCILSGKKLVWNKGVSIPSNATSSPVQTEKSSSINPLSTDSRITPSSSLTSLDVCKTTDLTPDYSSTGEKFLRNGFPRPTQALAGKKTARALVIPFSFKDLPFKVEKFQSRQLFLSDLETMNEVIPQVESAFKYLSQGRFELKFDVLPKSQWWVFDQPHPFTNVSQVDNLGTFIKVIESSKPEYKLDDYDAYIFLGGHGEYGAPGYGPAQAGFAEKISNAKNGYFNGVFIIGGFGQPSLWVHELGHALFAFEDLYLFGPSTSTKAKDEDVPNLWDLMADSSKLQLLEWNRLLMGWLDDSEVRCLSNETSTVHFLSEFNSTKDPKILTINLAPGVTLAAEPRGTANAGKGLLLYTINTYVPHGAGPIVSQTTLVQKGKSKSLYGWDFSVLDSNETGLLVSVTKTDKNKFVPPVVAPQQPQSNKPSGPEPTPVPSPKPSVAPPQIDRNSNVEGQGCSHGEPDLVNSFGTFVCTSLPDGNNLWKKKS